jgi:hypothetical protein
VFGEYQAHRQRYAFRVRFLEPVPPTWAITLGDVTHNARSALDHLGYVVVLANNGHRDEWTQFPITVNPFSWREASRGIRNASQRHIDIIESFQPYYRVDLWGYKWVWSAIDDPLAVLNRLSNIDKHRVLHATPAAITSMGYDFEVVRDVASMGSSEVNHDALLDKDEIVSVEISPDGPDPEFRLKRHETIQIGIQYRFDIERRIYTLKTVPLKETIDAILDRLVEIYEAFVGEFR